MGPNVVVHSMDAEGVIYKGLTLETHRLIRLLLVSIVDRNTPFFISK